MRWSSLAVLGDSFSEGLDDIRPDGTYRGWADRVAERLAAVHASTADDGSGAPGPFRYANLAVRGKRTADVVAEQVPVAVRLRPDLVTLSCGVNDILRPRSDLGAVAADVDAAVAALRAAGCDVLLFVGVDPSRRSAALRTLMPRIRALNAVMAAAASRHDALTVDLFDARVFDDGRLWAPDRLHLSSLGHGRVAGAVLEALGVGDSGWREPLPDGPASVRREILADDVRWLVRHLGPWLVRGVRGRSAGDGVEAKRPGLDPVAAPARPPTPTPHPPPQPPLLIMEKATSERGSEVAFSMINRRVVGRRRRFSPSGR